ncbi:hypothetical protein IF188_02025 [Microbacterium sp. NEAU-LLC]|uniref:YCII-related domain-containing protein n=1 Tax=Microbacterium helvum TaxID=2773713 RepID=A0ABR8NL17_9MICO|nr:hypothetical protein [Microbacterium helvum]MBD3940477.1 hypothetical protein [Microbacterium helvum]
MTKRYVVLYRAPRSVAERFAQATPEEAQQGLTLWHDWAARLGPALVDVGRPLGAKVDVTPDGVVDSGSDVIGMSLIEAESMDAALALVRDHHHLHWAEDCSITLIEEAPIPELQG